MNLRFLNVFALFVLPVVLAAQSLTVLEAGERGMALRFGRIINANLSPGLYLNMPRLHEIRRFDGRRQISDSGFTEIMTADKNRLRVDAYVVWQVADTRHYFLRTGADTDKVNSLLVPPIKTALIRAFAGTDMQAGFSGLSPAALTAIITGLNAKAGRELGITVLDVRLRRSTFPDAVEKAVYLRMRSEREREAERYRAEGAEKSAAITLMASQEKAHILASAREQAERKRGEGDAAAAAIAASTSAKNPELYRYWRSLQGK